MRLTQPDSNLPREYKGGGWSVGYAPFMRPADQGSCEPPHRDTDFGFRTALAGRTPR